MPESTAAGSQFRTERDSLGEMRVPADALYGSQTQRAVENFPISNLRFPRRFIAAMGIIKRAAAEANMELDQLDERIGRAIIAAADEVIEGKLDDQFVLDIFQTGSGTSTNMNANEVIASRASQILGDGAKVHPNDQVNMGQSSNDVIPTAMHVAARVAIHEDLLPALERLQEALEAKAEEFDDVVKSGRTHLMDATPVRLGQEFGGYASQIEHNIVRIRDASEDLAELALGGTAVGTGTNRLPDFPEAAIRRINDATGLEFREAENHFEAQAAKDAYVYASGALNTLAVSLLKIANDIRWLASGPTSGIAEITLPAIQPGSSIMPGKVNPVICESVIQVGAQVTGNCQAIVVGGQWGQLDLNVMLPMMARNMVESVDLLANVARLFVDKCLAGTVANVARAEGYVEGSIAMATALN
ncbi:MAG: class II fumarate hydratase, partial [Longimicrobiaceae bacterium]